jgi:hypothetical protein
MRFTVEHADRRMPGADRPAFRAWWEWAAMQQPVVGSRESRRGTIAKMAELRAAVLAGRRVDAAVVVALSRDRDGREWLDALSRAARLTARHSTVRPAVPTPLPVPAWARPRRLVPSILRVPESWDRGGSVRLR